ncbi:MAG: aryl-sulfate sulfotransferase [Kofleriaceae bacterium]
MTDIVTSPLALTPAFSTTITDYYVPCASGDNSLDVTVTDANGTSTTTMIVQPDDELDLGDYHVRCLPPDFPAITVTLHPENGAPTPGYYLVNSSPYVMVLDGNGVPIWYEATTWGCNVSSPAPNVIAYMPRAEYPYAWDEQSFYEIHDLSTGDVRTLITADAPTDEHELVKLDTGNYLVFTDPIDSIDGVTIANCKIEEVDPSGATVWSWLASDHVDPVQEPVYVSTNLIDDQVVTDVFHCNSIEVGSANDLLISMRHTSALYDIDRTTGAVNWKLGGNAISSGPHLDVVGDADGGFNMQHDARFTAAGTITLFDDHGNSDGVARGLELAVDHDASTASIVWQARADQQSAYMGGMRRYTDGESVIAWGYLDGDTRIFTEYNADALPVLDISSYLETTFNALTYRAVKVPLDQFDIALLRSRTAQ